MSNRLFVGNLPFHATEDLLTRHFGQCGAVMSVTVVTDRETGRSRGFAFVEMESGPAAQKAILELDGQDMEGRSLNVKVAEDRRGGGGGGGFRDRGERRGRGGR